MLAAEFKAGNPSGLLRKPQRKSGALPLIEPEVSDMGTPRRGYMTKENLIEGHVEWTFP